jgi:hypothetical protein
MSDNWQLPSDLGFSSMLEWNELIMRAICEICRVPSELFENTPRARAISALLIAGRNEEAQWLREYWIEKD